MLSKKKLEVDATDSAETQKGYYEQHVIAYNLIQIADGVVQNLWERKEVAMVKDFHFSNKWCR